jgi:1-pyrroline-5-carboxylate dehydrogenase
MTGLVHREAYDDNKFETAFQAILQMDKRDYPSYIGGLMVASGVDYPICSPMDESICFGTFQESEPGIADEAVNAALKKFEEWSAMALFERMQIIEKIYNLLEGQRYRLAAAVLVSSGMTRQESLEEVDTLLGIIEEATDKVKQLCGKPMGPWAIIASHSSPLASPIGYAMVAMLAGNTTVVMPSKHTPMPVFMVYDLCVKAGLPDGVFNLIIDRNDQTQIDLANDELLAGVVVSGPGKSFEEMMFLMVDDQLSFYNELKGMNPILIYKPADMKKAVKDVLDSAFRYMGQGLYSTSKVVVTIEDQKRFMDVLMEQVKTLKITDPSEKDAFCGPLISKDSKKAFDSFISKMTSNIIYGGKPVISEFTQNGSYVTPVVVTGLDDEDDEAYMDLGLPVLYIKMVSDLDEAFEELAYTECGLSAGVFSKDQRVIDRFKSESDIPIVFVNDSSRLLKPGIYASIENFVK